VVQNAGFNRVRKTDASANTRVPSASTSRLYASKRMLEKRVLGYIGGSDGLVLAAFSPQNIDRFVTMFRATRRSGRTFISDFYLARLLDELALPSLPRAGRGLRVYLPDRQKRKMVAEKAFELVTRYRSARIYRAEIAADPSRWVMLFRESMMGDIDRLSIHAENSLWPGYLNRAGEKLRGWCQERDIELRICHASGHADPKTLIRLAKALAPRVVIPIHTAAPGKFLDLVPNVRILNNLDWLEVSEA
jgi:ribonuclease J